VAARYIGPPITDDTDVFGCRYRDVDYGRGDYSECVFSPLAQFKSVEQIEANYTWPSPDWWDYHEISNQIKGWEDYPIEGGYYEPFARYRILRGDELAYMDLVQNPEMVQYCLEKLFDLAYTDAVRIYEQIPGQVMLTRVSEDLGGQQNLLISPIHIRQFLLPGIQRMIDLAHQAGAFVFHHDDGNCRRILPDLVQAGIDILNPIQWRCKDMDREGLKKDFGERLVFHGGMDNQYTLPFGTIAEVEQEVLDNLRILGANGGYILAPCHRIQVVSPPENILALYAAGYKHGWVE
jgi:uroporphyrinogen decarboxylase